MMDNYFSTNRAIAGGNTSSKANGVAVGGGTFSEANEAAVGGGTTSEANVVVAGDGTASEANGMIAEDGTTAAYEAHGTTVGSGTSSEANGVAEGGGTTSEASGMIPEDATIASEANVAAVTQNNLQQIADPRRSLKGWMFTCWRLVCWSGVTLLVNDSMYDIVFYIRASIFTSDKRVFSLSARTAKLIDQRRFETFREVDLDATVILVSGLPDCRILTLTPDCFKEYSKLNFRISDANGLEPFDETRRYCF